LPRRTDSQVAKTRQLLRSYNPSSQSAAKSGALSRETAPMGSGLEALADALLKLSPQDRARLAAVLLGDRRELT
jgi:hypothetical protein